MKEKLENFIRDNKRELRHFIEDNEWTIEKFIIAGVALTSAGIGFHVMSRMPAQPDVEFAYPACIALGASALSWAIKGFDKKFEAMNFPATMATTTVAYLSTIAGALANKVYNLF